MINFPNPYTVETGSKLDNLLRCCLLGWLLMGRDKDNTTILIQPEKQYEIIKQGWKPIPGLPPDNCIPYLYDKLMLFSADWRGAGLVAEAMKEKGYFLCTYSHPNGYRASFNNLNPDRYYMADAPTLPLAVSRAALAYLVDHQTT